MERMRELIKILDEASQAYYHENKELMTDREYDALYDELKQREAELGVVLSNSPTHQVGYTVLGDLVKVPHDIRLLSLDKTKEIEKLQSFLGDAQGILSWKLDGLTIVLKYSGGVLVQAVTRGNGEVGEDITHNALQFANIPHKIKYTGELHVRGEAVISFTDFKRINETIDEEEKYKNPRNLCSGTVRHLNNEIAAKRNVRYFAFTILRAEGVEFEDRKSNQLKWLVDLGFSTVEHLQTTTEQLPDAVLYFKNKIAEYDFATDGLVLTFDSLAYSKALGETAKFPKDSLAFKWADEIAETKLLAIQWNTSRTGLINPIAVFEPVELEGTTVNKASLHNVSILQGLELGLGDTITVYKANMVIPQIAENRTKSNTAEIPLTCPECGLATEIVQQNEGKALYCVNPNCKAQLVRSLEHFVSRDAMNIIGLSGATIEKFVTSKFIKNYTDFYSLNQYESEIIQMEGFGAKSYQNMIEAIEKSKDVELYQFIHALGINQVGLSNAKLLVNYFAYDISRIIHAEQAELERIEGYGEIIARSLVNYFSNEQNLLLLNKALTILRIKAPDASKLSKEEQGLHNTTFVITGDVHHFENRKELQKLIEQNGGKVTSSVTKKTSYLINNDTLSESSKNKKAKELGIPIISEDDFLQQFGLGITK